MNELHWLMLSGDNSEMLIRLVVAVVVGAVIGGERSYHGRPAGFRTHALVCTASSLLMLVTAYDSHWVRTSVEMVRLDPTRMAQGIMTGIGFLGAGVILKDGLAVRGLTTAASVWITAALGILAGIGFYFPLLVATILTILILAVLRWLEVRMPIQTHYHFEVRLAHSAATDEKALFAVIEGHDFSVADVSHCLDRKSGLRRYSMTLRSAGHDSASRLAARLESQKDIQAFRLEPVGK